MTTTDTTELTFDNLQLAWEGINEFLLKEEHQIQSRFKGNAGNQIICYNNHVYIKSLWMDEGFDLGKMLGYSPKKWVTLVKNYVDFNYLDLVKAEIAQRVAKKAKSYNYSYHFSNAYGSGKDCLVALIFTKRLYSPKPTLTFVIRTSEVTKRLIFDFLLVKRIAEYVYGPNQDCEVELIAPSYFITAESIVMYDNIRPIKKLLRKARKTQTLGKFQKKVLATYEHFMTSPLKKITYKVNQRSAAQIQRDENGEPLSGVPSMKISSLQLFNYRIKYPKDCISPKERAAFRKEKGLK